MPISYILYVLNKNLNEFQSKHFFFLNITITNFSGILTHNNIIL